VCLYVARRKNPLLVLIKKNYLSSADSDNVVKILFSSHFNFVGRFSEMEVQKEHSDVEVPTWKAPGIVTPSGTHYILEGNTDRPLILCIHGIGSYHFYFDGLAKSLVSSGYRVLRYDLIGRGFSEPSDAYDRTAHLKQIRDLLQHLGLSTTPRHVIGHSMGGALALLHADEEAEHVSSLTLLAPAGLMDGAIFAVLRSCTCLHGAISAFLRRGQVNFNTFSRYLYFHIGFIVRTHRA
jgi:pimeloyl-ACP methyl ester carboxylesterase